MMKSDWAVCTGKRQHFNQLRLKFPCGIFACCFKTHFYYRFVFWDPRFLSALPSGSDSSIPPASLERRQVSGAHQGLPWDPAFVILLLRTRKHWGTLGAGCSPGSILRASVSEHSSSWNPHLLLLVMVWEQDLMCSRMASNSI